jgi:hypothetical protein
MCVRHSSAVSPVSDVTECGTHTRIVVYAKPKHPTVWLDAECWGFGLIAACEVGVENPNIRS